MKCDMCNARDATVHLTEIINDQVTKLHLCEECAQEKSEEMQSHFGLTDLLAGLMDFKPSEGVGSVEAEITSKCPGCGMTYHDFQQTGKLGCAECYDAFSDDLSALLKKIHGSDRHTGKVPFMQTRTAEDRETLQRLRGELDRLIQLEDFEKAAVMRDRMRELEDKMIKKGKDEAE